MEERLEKILEIKVEASEAIKGIGRLNEEISKQREIQSKLKQEIKDLIDAEGDHTAEIEKKRIELAQSNELTKTYSSEVQRLSKMVQNQLKMDKEQIGSMQQLRAQLSDLTRQYDELAEGEREAAKGQELKDKINQVTDALKNSEEATQRYYRNVGNYENAIKNTIGLNSKYGQTLQNVADTTKNGITPALGAMKIALIAVGKQLLALMANPIVAIIVALAAAFLGAAKGIKSSEESLARFKAVTAAFKPIGDAVTNVFQAMGKALLSVVEWIGKGVGGFTKLLEKLPIVGDNIKAINDESRRYIQLEKDKQALVERNRDLIVSSAKAERDVAELRTKAKDKEHYTDQERLKFVQEANEIERKIADEKKAVAEENLRLLKEEAKATENKAEVNDRLKQAEAEVYRAETEYNTKIRELLEQENTIKNEIAAKDKARADAAEAENDRKLAEQEKYNEALLDALQEAEDAEIALIKNQAEQEQKLERVRHERRMAELEAKQNEYKNDEEMFKAYARQIEAEQQAHADNMAQLSYDARMREADERALEWENRITEARQNGEDYKALTLEMLETQLSEIERLQGESDEEYKARQLALKDEIIEIKQEQADKEKQIEREKIQVISGFLGNLSSVLEATAGDNLKRLKAAKVAALAEVMFNQGIAISSAVASQGTGDPYTYVFRVASAVAAAIASIVPAIQSVNSVKLARGGHVSGPGTSTSDSVPAMLSNGEFVVNARATSMFPELLETINNLGLGIAAPARVEAAYQTRQEAMTMDMMIKAFKHLPRPVVSVEEVTRVKNRVDSLENLTKL